MRESIFGVEYRGPDARVLDPKYEFKSTPEQHIDFRYVKDIAGVYHLARSNSGCLDYIAKDFIIPTITSEEWSSRKVIPNGKKAPFTVYSPKCLEDDLAKILSASPAQRLGFEDDFKNRFYSSSTSAFITARVKSEDRMSSKIARFLVDDNKPDVGDDVLGLRTVFSTRAEAEYVADTVKKLLLNNEFTLSNVQKYDVPGKHFSYKLDALYDTARGPIPIAMQFMSLDDFITDLNDHDLFEKRQQDRLEHCAKEQGFLVCDLLRKIKREIRRISN